MPALVALQPSEHQQALLRAIADGVSGGFTIENNRGRLIQVSDEFCRMVGFTREEVLEASPPYPFWPSQCIGRLRDVFQPETEVRAPSDGAHFFQRKNAELFPVLVFRQTLPWHGTETLTLSNIIDISPQLERDETLIRNERRRHLIEESAGIGTWETNLETLVTERSGECKRINQLDPDEESDYEAWVKHVHPDDLSLFSREALEAHKGGLPFEIEYRVRCDSGAERWILSKGRTIFDLAGQPTSILGINIDITERKNAAAELDQYRRHLEDIVVARTTDLIKAKDSAEAGARAKTAFLRTVSHELRTPLTGIMGMTELAMRHCDDKRVTDTLANVMTSARGLLVLINDILDLSRVEANRLDLEDGDVSLAELLTNLVAVIEPSATVKGVKITTSITEELAQAPLRGDMRRIGQVLLNLTGNAIKFTAQGAVTVNVRQVAAEASSVSVIFEIQDSGIGISKTDQMRLFKPFEQTDSSIERKFGGTGLGLSICKHLVEAMGGTIGMTSHEGSGSTFWFTLTLQRAAKNSVSEAERTSSAPAMLATRHAGARLLLAEDDLIIREIVKALIAETGLRLDLAEDGDEAVRMAKQSPYDLILMDMQMPRLNGIEATRQIRQLSEGLHTPIVAMTASAFPEDREKCFASGMNDFIAKPLDTNIVYATILKWLDKTKHHCVPDTTNMAPKGRHE